MSKSEAAGHGERRAHQRLVRTLTLWSVCVLWVVLVALGIGSIVNYQTGAGRQGTAPTAWPQASALRLGPALGTLLMFVQSCSCSRASIAELARLSSRVWCSDAPRSVLSAR